MPATDALINQRLINQGVGDLGSAIFGNPQKAGQFALQKAQAANADARTELAGIQGQKAAAEIKKIENELNFNRDFGSGLGALLNPVPETLPAGVQGPLRPEVLPGADIIQQRGLNLAGDFIQGGGDPSKLGNILRFVEAQGGAAGIGTPSEIEQRLRIQNAGAGTLPSVGTAITTQRADEIAPTDTRIGQVFSSLDSTAQENITATKLAGGTVRNFVTPEGKTGIAVGSFEPTPEGLKPLPAGTQVFSAQATGEGPAGALGITTPVKTGAQGQAIEITNAQNTIDTLRDLAINNPKSFGATGRLRGLTQDLIEQQDVFAQTIGLQAEGIQSNIAQLGQDIDVGQFDKSIPAIDLHANILAYQLASAVAKQAGRALSDKDFDRFKKVVGNPSALLSSQAKFLSSLEESQKILNGVGTNLGQTLQSGQVQLPTPGGTQETQPPTIPEGTTATNPNTGERIIRRGGEWQAL